MHRARNIRPFLSESRPDLVAQIDQLSAATMQLSAAEREGRLREASAKIVGWLCSRCGARWEQPVFARTRKYSGTFCHECNIRASRTRDKPTLDATHPELCCDWPKDEVLRPQYYVADSHMKARWICHRCGHEWRAVIQNRTRNKAGCPECMRGYRSSRLETRIYVEVKAIFGESVRWRDRKALDGMELDVYVPSHRFAVEHDGGYYHAQDSSNRKDEERDRAAVDRGIQLFRVRDDRLHELSGSHAVVWFRNGEPHLGIVKRLLRVVQQTVRLTAEESSAISGYIEGGRYLDSAAYDALEASFPSPPPGERLTDHFPDIAAEWSPKNHRQPHEVSVASNKRVIWQCKRVSYHEYRTSVGNRTSGGTGCPFCAGKRIHEQESIAVTHPEVAKHLEDQSFATKLGRRSQKPVGWLVCSNPDHRFSTTVATRIKQHRRRPDRCPRCFDEELVECFVRYHLGQCIQQDIASQMGISRELVSLIKRGLKRPDIYNAVAERLKLLRQADDGASVLPATSRRGGSLHYRTRHSDEVVQDAIRRVLSGSATQTEVATELGVNIQLVHSWVTGRSRGSNLESVQAELNRVSPGLAPRPDPRSH